MSARTTQRDTSSAPTHCTIVLRRLRQREEVAEDRAQTTIMMIMQLACAARTSALRSDWRFTLPSRSASSEGAEGAEAGGFGRRGDAGVDDAGDHAMNSSEHRPDDLERSRNFSPIVYAGCRAARDDGSMRDQRPDRRHDRQRDEHAGDDAADQQLCRC